MTDAVLPTSALRTARRRSPFRRKAFPYLLVAPAVVYLLAITLYPGIFALWRSFYQGRFKLEFIGFQNYVDLFADEAFWHSLSNTLIIGGITLAIEFVIAMTLAALVYRDPFVRGWRIIFLLPMLFMPSAVAYLWKLLFNDGRVISDLLMRVGLVDSNIDFMGSSWLARGVLVVTDVWQWVPFLFIIFVAALQGQDKEIEEAARLDGARWGQIFFSISLPLMRPVIAIALVLRGIDILTMFASPHIITQGAPAGDTETVSYFIYRTGFKSFEFGYASAASVVVLVLTIILAQSFVRRFFKSGRD
ncbi:sugar ABC transporter permease [Aestuariivirga litoralis]|uniref:Sugar ABC transporter permease n=1 Tax=Aestuariivirga litoralis TaxID=2650924 RepID=A0A2W2BRW7_9HYPH|nr:sugar ABC transporter permease [Aestuariivirga litoralis]PZF76176.1 sugar ABC transporter permease [Aestuariivirga litoralis]